MAVVQRAFGRKPTNLKDLLAAGKEFTDAAMDLEIDDVLKEARYQRRIGHAAAHLSGVAIQREGDGTSKRLVFAAYDTLYDLMHPSLEAHGADTAYDIFTAPVTRETILDLSENISSYGLSKIAYQYRTQGNYLHVTDEGLQLDEAQPIPKKFETVRGGCPYAKAKNAPYFNRFTDRIVETYAEAHRQNMPHGWLGATSRLFLKR